MVARKRSRRMILFGPAPILKGEDSEAYDSLFTRISMDVKPTDIIEEMWIKDVADITWDILRYRRVKKNWLAALKSDALENELEHILDEKAEIGWNQLSE
jgi:ribosomal protein S12 methylthiotransferase accessory factor YcaO